MLQAVNTAATAVSAGGGTVATLPLGGAGPGAVAIGVIGNITGIAAAGTVQAAIVRTDTGAIIGSTTVTNNGAGTGPIGGVVVVAPIPPGCPGISLQVFGTGGSAVGSATAPATLTVLP